LGSQTRAKALTNPASSRSVRQEPRRRPERNAAHRRRNFGRDHRLHEAAGPSQQAIPLLVQLDLRAPAHTCATRIAAATSTATAYTSTACSSRVPCLLRWPGVIRPGTVKNELMSHNDWIPTLCAIAAVAQKDPAAGTLVAARGWPSGRSQVHFGFDAIGVEGW
jgi:Sulfatase